MKAIVQDRYGSPDEVLQLREINKPVIGDDEVLVRVRAASVHPDVWHVQTRRAFTVRQPVAGPELFDSEQERHHGRIERVPRSRKAHAYHCQNVPAE